MKKFIKDYFNNYKILKQNLGRFIKYLLTTKILFFVIMLPLLRSTINLLMKSKGYSYITNGILVKFLLSPQGVILAIVSMVVGVSVVLIEIGGLIVLSYQSINNIPESNYFEVVKFCLRKLKILLRVDGLIVLFYMFIMLPLIDYGVRTSVLTRIKIPGFILDVIQSNVFYSTILVAITIIFIILTIKWFFALHVLMLSNNKKPFKESSRLVKVNFKSMIGYFIGIGLLSILVFVFLILLYLIISVLLLMIAGQSLEPFAIYGILGIGITFTSVISFLLLPFQMIYTTKFYCMVQNDEHIKLNLKYKGKEAIFDKMLRNKKLVIIIFIIAVASVSLFTGLFNEYFSYLNFNVNFTAHRGSSYDAPENTLEAIEKAIELKATYVEIDVQEAKDQSIVLLHDKSFSRTAGIDKEVWQVSLAEIKELDAGSYFSEEFRGVKIPTLAEVIDLADGKILLNIEVKIHGHEQNLIPNLIKLLKEKNLINSCIISSLDYDVLNYIEKLEPRLRTGYIMYVAVGNLENLNVDFYSVEKSNVTESFVEKAHAIGREVHVWTINNVSDLEDVISLGVDNIITDNIPLLREKLQSLKREQFNFEIFKGIE